MWLKNGYDVDQIVKKKKNRIQTIFFIQIHEFLTLFYFFIASQTISTHFFSVYREHGTNRKT